MAACLVATKTYLLVHSCVGACAGVGVGAWYDRARSCALALTHRLRANIMGAQGREHHTTEQRAGHNRTGAQAILRESADSSYNAIVSVMRCTMSSSFTNCLRSKVFAACQQVLSERSDNAETHIVRCEVSRQSSDVLRQQAAGQWRQLARVRARSSLLNPQLRLRTSSTNSFWRPRRPAMHLAATGRPTAQASGAPATPQDATCGRRPQISTTILTTSCGCRTWCRQRLSSAR